MNHHHLRIALTLGLLCGSLRATLTPMNAVADSPRPVATPSTAPAVSPLDPWRGVTPAGAESVTTDASSPWWQAALLWIPNRLADLLDVFRFDLGVGPAVGGVVRVTRYGQVGYRMVLPMSVRAGLFGREVPLLIERSNEFGVGPLYVSSADRTVCSGELGAGADLFIAGAYGGVCLEEVADFVAGLFLLDLRDDDWR